MALAQFPDFYITVTLELVNKAEFLWIICYIELMAINWIQIGKWPHIKRWLFNWNLQRSLISWCALCERWHRISRSSGSICCGCRCVSVCLEWISLEISVAALHTRSFQCYLNSVEWARFSPIRFILSTNKLVMLNL